MFARLGDFEMAEEILQEAMDSRCNPHAVKSARDFAIVFNNYAKLLSELWRINPTDDSTKAKLEQLLLLRPLMLQETILVTAFNDVKEW